jgi:hypothetical protein
LPRRLSGGGGGLFGPYFRQLAGIQPIAGAVGTLVYLDRAFGAIKVALKLDARAAGTFPLARRVNHDAFIAQDFEQGLSGGFTRVVHAMKLERIEPNAAAAPLANIYEHGADLSFDQFIETSRAFHIIQGVV